MKKATRTPAGAPVPAQTELPYGLHRLLREIGEKEAAGRLAELHAAHGQPELRVVVFGEFNHGKSTLINALLGRELLTVDIVPTTGHITQVIAGEPEEVCIHYTSGAIEAVPIDRLGSLSTLDMEGRTREDIDLLVVRAASGIVRQGVMLIDTPGTNDAAAQTRRAMRALSMADAVIWVLHADHCLRQGDRALAARWFEHCGDAPLVPVLNFMNLLPRDRDRQMVRERAARILGRQFGKLVELARMHSPGRQPFLEIDAMTALDRALAGDREPEDPLSRLETLLTFLHCGAMPACRAARAARLRSDIMRLREKNRVALEALQRDADAGRRAVTERKREAEERRRRFLAMAERKFLAVSSAASDALAANERQLVDSWLSGESLSRLRANTASWFERKMNDALGTIANSANLALRALAAEHHMHAGLALPEKWLAYSSWVAMPPASAWDELKDFFNGEPGPEFMSALRSRVRKAWSQAAAQARTRLHEWWGERMHAMISEADGEVPVPTVEITEALTRLLAHALWIEGGARFDGDGVAVWQDARLRLNVRAASGELLSEEQVRRETVETALAAFERELSGPHSALVSSGFPTLASFVFSEP